MSLPDPKRCTDETDPVQTDPISYAAELKAGCLTRLMERTLDSRLLKLKANNRKQFGKEMKLQKHFNSAVEDTCSSFYIRCKNSGWQLRYFNCQVALLDYRIEQAIAIQAKRLSVTASPGESALAKDFEEFSRSLCALPRDLWQAFPKSCPSLVLLEIDQVLRAHEISPDTCAP